MKTDKIQFGFVTCGILTICLYNVFSDISFFSMLIILSIGISIFGLPHGAIDGYLAQRAGFTKNISSATLFIFVYLTLSGLVICAWIIFPDAMFILFLCITVWHFGEDGGASNAYERVLFGLSVLTLPVLFQPQVTEDIFAYLAISNAAGNVEFMKILGVVVLFVSVLSAVRMQVLKKQGQMQFLTYIALVLFAFVLHPLIYFALYFCALHSPRHFNNISQAVPIEERRQFLISAFLYTLTTLILAGFAFWLLSPFVVLYQAFTLVIFVGLAALTVPHMILVDGIWSRNI